MSDGETMGKEFLNGEMIKVRARLEEGISFHSAFTVVESVRR
jgi:hypothetical protein